MFLQYEYDDMTPFSLGPRHFLGYVIRDWSNKKGGPGSCLLPDVDLVISPGRFPYRLDDRNHINITHYQTQQLKSTKTGVTLSTLHLYRSC
jgi:hypothetical protein